MTASISWLCLWALCSLVSSTEEASTANKEVQIGAGECVSPYKPVGPNDYCLLIDNRIEGSWDEMRTFCKQYHGDLAFFKDANLLYDVVDYINEHSLNDSSFWIGSEDLLAEGDWVWCWNNDDVRMNTPLWAPTSFSQEPKGGSTQNCGLLSKDYFYFMDDYNCEGVAGVICDPLTNKNTNPGKVAEKATKKTQSGDCPVPFQLIGDSCLLINSIKSNTWEDGKLLCQGLGGHMAIVDDANLLGDLYDIFINKSITVDLWLGGTDIHQEGTWIWEDGSSVKMETPFWGINNYGHQEPNGGLTQNCLGLAHLNRFFFNDLKCTQEAGVICQYDI